MNTIKSVLEEKYPLDMILNHYSLMNSKSCFNSQATKQSREEEEDGESIWRRGGLIIIF